MDSGCGHAQPEVPKSSLQRRRWEYPLSTSPFPAEIEAVGDWKVGDGSGQDRSIENRGRSIDELEWV